MTQRHRRAITALLLVPAFFALELFALERAGSPEIRVDVSERSHRVRMLQEARDAWGIIEEEARELLRARERPLQHS